MIQNSTNVFNVWEKQARENVAMARTDLEEPHLESQVNSFCEANFEKSKKNKKKQFVGSSSLFFFKKKNCFIRDLCNLFGQQFCATCHYLFNSVDHPIVFFKLVCKLL
jgi:hypothetical protein